MRNVEETLGPNIASFSTVADEDEILRRYEANFSSVYMGIVFDITAGKDLRYMKAYKYQHIKTLYPNISCAGACSKTKNIQRYKN